MMKIITGFAFAVFGALFIETGLDDDVLQSTNQFRKQNHLSALILQSDLSKLAREHSEDMAKGKCGFGHAGFDKRAKKAEKDLDTDEIAENVAFGARSGREVVDMWKHSEGHRTNMLGPYHYIGIGTATDRNGVIYYTQIFAR